MCRYENSGCHESVISRFLKLDAARCVSWGRGHRTVSLSAVQSGKLRHCEGRTRSKRKDAEREGMDYGERDAKTEDYEEHKKKGKKEWEKMESKNG